MNLGWTFMCLLLVGCESTCELKTVPAQPETPLQWCYHDCYDRCGAGTCAMTCQMHWGCYEQCKEDCRRQERETR